MTLVKGANPYSQILLCVLWASTLIMCVEKLEKRREQNNTMQKSSAPCFCVVSSIGPKVNGGLSREKFWILPVSLPGHN